jgi:hypothetical protein
MHLPSTREFGWNRDAMPTIVAVALALFAGTVMWWVPRLFSVPDAFDAEGPFFTILGVLFVLALIAGALIHSWWALLIVPVAWTVGEMLSMTLAYAGAEFDPMQGWWGHFWSINSVIIPMGLAPVILGTGIGALIGALWLRRQRHA